MTSDATYSQCSFQRSVMPFPLLFCVLVLLTTALPGSAAASVDPSCEPASPAGAAVVLSITGHSGEAFRVVAPEGQLASYHDFSTGRALAIVPRIVDAAGGDLDLDVYRLEAGAYSEPMVLRERIDSIRAKVGYPSHLSLEEFLRIDVIQFVPTVTASGPMSTLSTVAVENPGETLLPAPGGGPCCITCDTVTVCGCSVSGSCGSCTGDC